MRCSRAQNLYEEFVSGGLDPEIARSVEEHLGQCPECREFFETNDDLAELISAGTEVAHPGNPYVADLSSRVLASVLGGEGKSAPPPPPRRADWNRPLWWAGAAAAAALVIFGINTPKIEEAPAPELASADDEMRSALAPAAPANPLSPPPAAGWETAWGATQPQYVVQRPNNGMAVEVANAPRAGAAVPSVEAEPSFDGRDISKSFVKNRADQERAAQERAAERQARAAAPAPPAAGPDSRDFVLRFFVGVEENETDPRRAAAPARPGEFDLPAQWLQQILQLDAMNTPQSRERMVAMLEQIADSAEDVMHGPRGEKASPSSVIRQCALFRQAEARMAEGDSSEALKSFESVLALDGATPLASRAALRIADIHYDERADYRQAWRFYAMLRQPSAQGAITADEAARAKRRVGLLAMTEGASWEPIRNARAVREGEWPEALEALRAARRGPIFKELIADLAEPLARRLDGALPMENAQALELNDMLNVGIGATEDRHAQAWLCLAQGDLLHKQFKKPEAQRSYQIVILRDRDSAAAQLAAARLERMLRAGVSASLR